LPLWRLLSRLDCPRWNCSGRQSPDHDNTISVEYSLKEDIPVEHVLGKKIDSVTISGQELKYGDKITVSAKVIYDNGEKYLKDVELISK
jgi:hypothetical protein